MQQEESYVSTIELASGEIPPKISLAQKKIRVGFRLSSKTVVGPELALAIGLCLPGLVSKTETLPLIGLNGLLLMAQLLGLIFGWPETGRREHLFLAGSLALILVGSGFGIVSGFNQTEALAIAGRLLAGFSLFLALSRWLGRNEKSVARLQRLGWLLVVGGVGLALLGLLGAQWNTKLYNLGLYEKLPKINLLGNINANLLAGGLVVLVPLPIGLALASKSWAGRRGLALGAELVLWAVLFLTQSRTAWLAGGGSLSFLLLLALLSLSTRHLTSRLRPRLVGLMLVSPVLVVGLALLNFDLGLLKPLKSRAEVWVLDARVVEQFPFTGIGFGNFRRSAPLFFPYFLDTSGSVHDALYAAYSDHVFNNHAHNLFFQVWLDLGLVGLLGFAGFMGWLLWQWWRFMLHIPLTRQNIIGYSFAAGLVAFLLQSLSDASLWTDRGGFTAWPVLAGLTVLPVFYSSSKAGAALSTRRFSVAVVIGVLLVLLLGFIVINWNGLVGIAQRNLGNLALQRVLLSSPEVLTESYESQFPIFLAKFYDIQAVKPDAAYLERAISAYRQALLANPTDVAAWRYLGLAEGLAGNVEASKQALEQALKVIPGEHYSAFIAGLLRYEQADYSGAAESWRQGRNGELYPLALAEWERFEVKDLAAAERDYRLSIQVRSTAFAYQQLGELAQGQQDWQRAADNFLAAIRLEPDNYYYYQQLGMAYLEQRRPTEAIAALNRALELSPGNRNIEALLQRAKA